MIVGRRRKSCTTELLTLLAGRNNLKVQAWFIFNNIWPQWPFSLVKLWRDLRSHFCHNTAQLAPVIPTNICLWQSQLVISTLFAHCAANNHHKILYIHCCYFPAKYWVVYPFFSSEGDSSVVEPSLLLWAIAGLQHHLDIQLYYRSAGYPRQLLASSQHMCINLPKASGLSQVSHSLFFTDLWPLGISVHQVVNQRILQSWERLGVVVHHTKAASLLPFKSTYSVSTFPPSYTSSVQRFLSSPNVLPSFRFRSLLIPQRCLTRHPINGGER